MFHFKKYNQNSFWIQFAKECSHPYLWSPPVPLGLQVTCGTSLWESSSFICQLSVIEQEADSKHSCSSAGIVTLASADMSAHCAAWCFIRSALILTAYTHKCKFKFFSWSVTSHFPILCQNQYCHNKKCLIYCCRFSARLVRWLRSPSEMRMRYSNTKIRDSVSRGYAYW